jgi:hypothetical protein
MSSNRCAACGFLNFATASVCKRCRASLQPPSDNPYFNSYVAGYYGGYQPAPAYGQPPYASSYYPVAPLPSVSRNAGVNIALLALLGMALAVAAGIWVFWKVGNNGSANFAWQEYNSEDGSYAIMMPTRPAHFTQTQQSVVGDLEVHMMAADMHNDGAFMVGHADYPGDSYAVSADELLDMSAQGAVNSTEATLLGKKKISLDGHPGLELELSLRKLKGRTVTRVYWVAPRRIYIMFASAPSSPETNARLATFLNSLRLRRK